MVRSKLYFQNVQTFWIGRQGRKQSNCPNLFLSILGYQVGRVDPVWTYVQTFVVFLIAGSPEAIFLDYIMQPTLVNYPRLSQATIFYYLRQLSYTTLGHYVRLSLATIFDHLWQLSSDYLRLSQTIMFNYLQLPMAILSNF